MNGVTTFSSIPIQIVQEYQRGVVFRLGRVIGTKAPGLRFLIPIVDRIVKVSLRIVTMPIPSQKIITRDNVSIDVAAVAYYHVVDPMKSVVAIESVEAAINQIAQTTVRNITGQSLLDEILAETDKLNESIKKVLDVQTEKWGVEISLVELKDIQLPESMQRAMAREAEAEREKRAKIIAAEGEALSAGKLAEAADVIGQHPIALQLRNLQVLVEIAAEKNSTIIFPNQFLSTIRDIKEFLASEGTSIPPGLG
ncbi:MAG: slipin family protein [Actinobacteria bacterium]|nr:slipin family protein [Actinomycetota bacterium]